MVEDSPLSVADVLDRAADLLTPEGAWTQCAEARDAAGSTVEASDPAATCWCLDGAYSFVGGEWNDRGWDLLRKVVRTGPISWNDDPRRKQAQVVSALRKAAALARTEAAHD